MEFIENDQLRKNFTWKCFSKHFMYTKFVQQLILITNVSIYANEILFFIDYFIEIGGQLSVSMSTFVRL